MTPLTDNADGLDELRQQIDRLDARLLQLLAKRQQLVKGIAQHKTKSQAIPAYERLLPMLRARGERATALGLDADFVVLLFQQIAHQAMKVQRAELTAPAEPHDSALPLVYSCSGCSSSAQLANDLALALDREQLAEMSCIAGIGGDVPALLKVAQSGRPMLVIDGCARICAKRSLNRHGIEPAQHVVLSKWGIQKNVHQHYRAEELLIAKARLHDGLIRLQAPARNSTEASAERENPT